MVSGMDVLRERIGQAIFDHMPGASWDAYKCRCGAAWTRDHAADAVIADLGLEEIIDDVSVPGRVWRRYVTPWERIEDDQ